MLSRLCVSGATCVVALCALVWPATTFAQDDAFKQGLQARGDRKWVEVIRHMQNAVKADSQESTRKVRSGLSGLVGAGMEYLPHYFLGEAYFNQQDCGSAVTELSVSEQQNAVRSRQEFVANIRKWYQACGAKGVLLPNDYTPLYLSTRQAYVEANAVAKRVSDLGALHKDLWRPDFDDQYRKAGDELKTSQTRLAAGQRTRLASDFAEAKAASERALGVLRPLETSVNAAIETVTTVQRQSKDIEQVIAGADAADRAVDGLKTTLTEALQASRQSGRDQLAQARASLATGQRTQSPTAVGEALKYAQSASTTLNQVLEQAKKLARGVFEQQFGDAVRAADDVFSRVSAAMSTLDRRASQKPDLVPQMAADRTALEKQIEALRRRFDRARKAEDLASLTETTRLAREAQVRLDTLTKSFGPLTLRDRGVDAALEEGARLFLDGEYEKALSVLEPIAGQPDVALQLHIHLFRAAALHALFVRSGETNQVLRTQALAEIALSRQLNSTFRPNPRAFSPRFLSLYQTGSVPTPQPAAGAAAQH